MRRRVVPVCLFIAAAYWMLVTRFTGVLIAPEWLSAVYDSLGSHLLHLSPEVDESAIRWEGIKVGGKIYAYFGPFPAFLRIILNGISPQFRGQWSRVSCLLAALLSVAAYGLMTWRVLAANSNLTSRQREMLCALLLLGFALGTPILYLISCARLYHEAILWGLCGATWCVYSISLLLFSPQRVIPVLLLFSVSVFVTLLSRITFGVAVVLVSPAVFMCSAENHWWIDRRRSVLRLLVFTPIVLSLAICGWYNYARFGSPFTFFDYRGFYLKADAMGGDFNVARIPDALRHYLGVSSKYFIGSLPFIRTITSNYVRPELFQPGWREQTISYVVASPWLLVLALLGPVFLVRLARKSLFIVAMTCFFVQVILIFSFYFVTERYAAELLPFLTLLSVPWLFHTKGSRKSILTLATLVVWSSYATIASTLDWNLIHNGDTDGTYKRQLAALFSSGARLPSYEGPRIYLSDLTPLQETTSFARMVKDKNAKGEVLEAGGERYPKGLGMHAYTKVSYAVPPGQSRFVAILAPSQSERSCEKMSYRMRLSDSNGRVLFESARFENRSQPVPIEIDLLGSTVVTLEVDPLEDGID